MMSRRRDNRRKKKAAFADCLSLTRVCDCLLNIHYTGQCSFVDHMNHFSADGGGV